MEIPSHRVAGPAPSPVPVTGVARTGGNSTDILDRNRLLLQCMNNEDLALKLLEMLAAQASKDIIEIEAAVAGRSADLLRRTAHRLKGDAANLAANGVWHSAAELESLAAKGDLDACRNVIESLRLEVGRFLEHVGKGRIFPESAQDPTCS